MDDNLKPIRKYCEEVLQQEEPCLYDTWDEAVLKDIISKQRKAVRDAKQAGETVMPSILIVCDDMMDDKMAMGGGILQQIFTRGRHFYCSCFLMTQKLRVIAHNQAAVRVNANALVMFRARNEKDVQAMIEENSALADTKMLRFFTTLLRAQSIRFYS